MVDRLPMSNEIIIESLPTLINLEICEALQGSAFPELEKLACANKTKYRALSCIFSYGLFKDDIIVAVPAAASVEIYTAATLILDDVVEKEELRRGEETLRKSKGEGYASLAAVEGILLPLRHISKKYGTEIERKAHSIYSESLLDSIRGEKDTKIEKGWQDSNAVDRYIKGMERINGKPYGFATALGAIVADASTKEVDKIRRYGFHKGVATQILGEIKNVYGEDDHAQLSEVRRGRNILWIYAKNNASKAELRNLKESLLRDNSNKFINYLEDTGALSFVQKLGKDHLAASLKSLAGFKNVYGDLLRQMDVDIDCELENYPKR